MFYLLLLIPCLLWANAGFQVPETMSNTMYIVNINDTLDSDNDGVMAWEESKAVVDSISTVLGEPCYTCLMEASYFYNDASYPQATWIDVLSMFVDTNRAYVPYTAVNLPAGDDYILTKLATCARAAQAYTSYYPKYFCFGPGMPRWFRPNTDPPFDDDPNTIGANNDSIVSRSLCDAVELLFNPAIDTVWSSSLKLTGIWGSRYIEAARGAALKGFIPGQYRQYKAGGTTSDSTLQWVICTQIDGFDDNDICNMIRKAYRGRYGGWQADGTPNYWAVVDGIGSFGPDFYAQYTSPYAYNNQMWDDFVEAFTLDRMLYDLYVPLIDSSNNPDDTIRVVIGGIPDTSYTYFGYNGGQTLAAGDTAIVYMTAGSYAEQPVPTSIAYETDLVLAPGALMHINESWNGYTIRDTTLRSGTEDDQTLMVEWFDDNGMNATYGTGNTREVSLSTTAANNRYIVDAMFTPEVPFAVVSELSTIRKQQCIAMGWPGFAWRQSDEAQAASAGYVGNCHEVLSYSATSPATADSVIYTIIYDAVSGDSTVTVRQDCNPSSAVTYSTGTRWNSIGLVSFTVSFIDPEGFYHSESIYYP